MKPIEAEKERIVRFYQFAKADFQREVRENYRLLRLPNDSGSIAAVNVMSSRPYEQQLVMANAVVKSAHPSGVLLSGEAFSDLERSAAEIWRQRTISEAGRLDGQRVVRARSLPTVKLKALRWELSRRDLNRFGVYIDRGHDFGYRTEIGDWTVDTLLMLCNRPYFGYWYNHWLMPSNASIDPNEFEVLGGLIDRHARSNFPLWLVPINAAFTVETEAEIPECVNGLLTVWDHYYANIRPILEDIKVTV